jgi:hypothetical protein
MAFSDFKNVTQVLQKYPLEVIRESFLPDVPIDLPAQFLADRNFLLNRQSEEESEMFYRESFIAPFLQLAWQRHPGLKLWVNRALRYDDTLFGEPDYFIAASIEGRVIDRFVSHPLLAVVEAKRQDFEGGWGQCLAEMVACQKLNEPATPTIFGIVSTGIYWEFGKLAGVAFTRELRSYIVTDPQRLFGAVDFVFAECERQLQSTLAAS